ncbi:c-type cytochrome [Lutibacter sp.]|uniref:c-type cytochrome n=1 Tax=Lutibacter sp. TaxID=1925666 RepID=UPI0025B7FAC6|nr:c-type cytochrome [Lutibacter sp.]MCF6182770.1 cytochrome c [Lutibacter sp.]
MKTKMNLGFGLLLTTLIMFAYGFQSSNSKTTANNYQPIKKELKITGSQLFQNNCAACHGSNRQGNPPTFPSLVNINKKLSKNQIGELLQTGRNIMPNFSHLSDSERNAIVGFLYGESTTSTVATKISSVEKGKNLFIANCARCHQPEANNSVTQNQNQMGMRMGMKPPVLNGVNQWVGINQFKRILNMGPCYMPSFATMDNTNKEDIYTYLSSLEVNSQNNYRMRRGGCGMMMGY